MGRRVLLFISPLNRQQLFAIFDQFHECYTLRRLSSTPIWQVTALSKHDKLRSSPLVTRTRLCLRPTAACSNSCFLSQIRINPFKVKGTLFWPASLSDGLQTEVRFGAERHKRKSTRIFQHRS